MELIPSVEKHVMELRGTPVLLDSDVAALYGVATKHINQAVANNPQKFPEGYVLALTDVEWNGLKSKFLTSIRGGKVKSPNAFTEKGLYMLATILKGDRATRTTLAIVETFAKFRELGRSLRELATVEDAAKKKSILQRSGEIVADILDEDLRSSETETTFELNIATLIKVKHTVKKERKKKNNDS